MKKLNSLIYLFYYLLLWVVLPAAGSGDGVLTSEVIDGSHYSISKGDTGYSEFRHFVNPEWYSVNSPESRQNLLSGTGHWAVLFSSVYKPSFRFSREEVLNPFFSNTPIWGALTATKIVFPFHYFW
ncbi:hypothetical protein J2X69_002668 [Algoriphagus sp. 4150]|uniref:hypothetical protein n=1 Tax=Algoriphagus sp. 4150 TaxID=2817756 RepID=UPI00285867D3|nr:hypothetical protein [Algoriphagus sp. 4150]MDR7130318.1 hypothetical protein [Algoriphagus sp. 4150]